MKEFLLEMFPNMANKMPELLTCTLQTLRMVAVSGVISFVLGVFFGVILTVCKPRGIMQCKPLYSVLDKVTNVLRSIPFIILLAQLIPVTRAIVGTAIGPRGAELPLIFGTVPFFSRQIEAALAKLDQGLVEAAQSMGDSPVRIIFNVYLRESVPNIVRGTAITFINLVGLSAMAGTVGGGGLGDFAIRYGQQRNQPDVTFVTIIVILIIVFTAQAIGNYIIKKTTH